MESLNNRHAWDEQFCPLFGGVLDFTQYFMVSLLQVICSYVYDEFVDLCIY